jgi:hypothetical protein
MVSSSEVRSNNHHINHHFSFCQNFIDILCPFNILGVLIDKNLNLQLRVALTKWKNLGSFHGKKIPLGLKQCEWIAFGKRTIFYCQS